MAPKLFSSPTARRRASRALPPDFSKRGDKSRRLPPGHRLAVPYEALHEVALQDSVKAIVTVEMSTGQMVDDVRIGVNGVKPVSFIGQAGGVIPTPREVANAALKLWEVKTWLSSIGDRKVSPMLKHTMPGCTHGIIHRLVAETLEELGVLGKTIGVAPVGAPSRLRLL